MKLHNEGTVDRWLRGILGVLVILSAPGLESGVLALQLAGAALLATGIIGWCPFYSVLHIDTANHERGG
jgi:hypothetical protein